MVMESFNPELTRLGKRRRCIFAEIINSQRTFEIFPFRPTFSPHKARQIRSCQFDLNRDDVGRNDPPTYVCSAWTNSGFVGLRGRSRKFEGCREICETRGKTHKSGSADFGAGLLGISPGDRARFNLSSRERPNALNAAAISHEEDLKIHRHYIFNLISLFLSHSLTLSLCAVIVKKDLSL